MKIPVAEKHVIPNPGYVAGQAVLFRIMVGENALIEIPLVCKTIGSAVEQADIERLYYLYLKEDGQYCTPDARCWGALISSDPQGTLSWHVVALDNEQKSESNPVILHELDA